MILNNKSAGPSLEGPPGCEEFPPSCIQCPLFLSFCIQVFSYPFIPAWLLLHSVSWIVLLAIWLLTVRPGINQFTLNQLGLRIWDPQRNTEKNIKFQARLQGIKSHENWSQGHPKTSKMDSQINRIPTSMKTCFLLPLLHQMFAFKTQTSRFRPTNR